MTTSNIHKILLISFGTLLTAGALLHIVNMQYAPYVFSAGAAMAVVSAFLQAWQNRTDDIRRNRLFRIQFLNSLVLVLAAYLMFTGSNSWVVMLLLYALISLFLSTRFK